MQGIDTSEPGVGRCKYIFAGMEKHFVLLGKVMGLESLLPQTRQAVCARYGCFAGAKVPISVPGNIEVVSGCDGLKMWTNNSGRRATQLERGDRVQIEW